MGLTSSSTGNNIFNDNFENLKSSCSYTIAFCGNPNVGKSSIFNSLTGLHQHTGNWPGKTISTACGICEYKHDQLLLVDLPGTYSLMSNSEEEEIARDYICFSQPDVCVVVVDATCIERNLNLVFQILEITPNVIVCVNLLDEAKKKGIYIDLNQLSERLGVPVVGTIAHIPKTLKKLLNQIVDICKTKNISPKLVTYPKVVENTISEMLPTISSQLNNKYISRWICLKLLDGDEKILSSLQKNLTINFSELELNNITNTLSSNGITPDIFRDEIVSSILFRSESICNDVCNITSLSGTQLNVDKFLTSKKFGIPIMIIFLGIIFWITIIGANYPSELLFNFFGFIQSKLYIFFDYINSPSWLTGILIDGMYQTLTWIVSVMLPPMAIFFPLFTILEDLGYLPRIAFNLDSCFKKSGSSGKQALTMCMGFGCNAAGVVGCRIINSPREKLIAILTNSFIPCNGRFPLLITISSIFIGSYFSGAFSTLLSTIIVLLVILFGIFLTLIISKFLSKTLLKGTSSSFILELPPYRKPQIGKVIIRSLFDRTLFILGRAVIIAAPTGILIWLLANIDISGYSILTHISNFLNPFASLIGLDGYILAGFVLGIPANEIVLPIILMSYLSTGTLVDFNDITVIGNILVQNGWTLLTAINVMLFTLLHFPCSTTLLTIKKEAGGWKWAFLAFLLPTLCGIIVCFLNTLVWNFVM